MNTVSFDRCRCDTFLSNEKQKFHFFLSFEKLSFFFLFLVLVQRCRCNKFSFNFESVMLQKFPWTLSRQIFCYDLNNSLIHNFLLLSSFVRFGTLSILSIEIHDINILEKVTQDNRSDKRSWFYFFYIITI